MPLTEGTSKTFQFRDFSKGMNRTASRPALDDNEVWWLENAQPIGKGQVTILPPPKAKIATIAAGVATLWGITIKLAGVETALLISVNGDGSVSAITTAGVVTTIAVAGTVTSAARLTMWQDNPLLIGDPTKGYFSWDGTTWLKYPVGLTADTHTNTTLDNIAPNTTGLVAGMAITGTNLPAGTTIAVVTGLNSLTLSQAATASTGGGTATVGAGAPTSVVDVAVFEGRAFLVSASRSITLTAPASYTDFATADGALTITITDSVFAGSIVRILSALEVLWVIGPSAINAISNVQIASGITTLSNTNIVSNVGTIFASSVSSFFRTFLLLAHYGVYAIVGATPQKLSEQLDGLFPDLPFGSDQPSGVVEINDVFVWCVLTPYTDPATNTTRQILLCFSRNAWFVASQDGGTLQTLTWVASLVDLTTGNPVLWGTDGFDIFQCFTGTGAGFYDLQTKSFDFGAFTQRKQVNRFALEVQNLSSTLALTATVENEFQQSYTIPLQFQSVTITFLGAGSVILTFTGVGAVAIVWLVNNLSPRAYCNMAGDYLNFRLTGTSMPFTISGIAIEVKACGEWT